MTKLHNLMLAALLLTVTTAHGEEIKLRNNGDACTSSNEGAIYYDDGDDTFYFCRNASTGWEAFEDLAPASSGGGVPTYMGLTNDMGSISGSTTGLFNGTLSGRNYSGIAYAHALCDYNYDGSRMMTISDLKYASVRDAITSTTQGWISPDHINYFNCADGNSVQWKSNSSSAYGFIYQGSNSYFQSSTQSRTYCNYSYPIHCVKD
jgi:hypothetical protein